MRPRAPGEPGALQEGGGLFEAEVQAAPRCCCGERALGREPHGGREPGFPVGGPRGKSGAGSIFPRATPSTSSLLPAQAAGTGMGAGPEPAPGPSVLLRQHGRCPQGTPRWALASHRTAEETEAGTLEDVCKVARQKAAPGSGLGARPCPPPPGTSSLPNTPGTGGGRAAGEPGSPPNLGGLRIGAGQGEGDMPPSGPP